MAVPSKELSPSVTVGTLRTVVSFKVVEIRWHWKRAIPRSVLVEDCFGNRQWLSVNDIYQMVVTSNVR